MILSCEQGVFKYNKRRLNELAYVVQYAAHNKVRVDSSKIKVPILSAEECIHVTRKLYGSFLR